jgi:hypothetical protein
MGPQAQGNIPPGAEVVGYEHLTNASAARRRAAADGSASRSLYVPRGGRMSLITY